MSKNLPELFEQVIAFVYWLVKGRRQERNKRIAEALMGYTVFNADFGIGPSFSTVQVWDGEKWLPWYEFHNNGH